jgi:molybdopterin synthase catalytic subunit
MGVSWALCSDPLDVTEVLAEVARPDCGAVASFVGTVRDSAAAPGHASDNVVALEYEAHPEMASEAFAAIAAEAMTRWDVKSIAARHRTGRCELGAPTVALACSAPHRADALAACHFLIDELKARVPIFKKEVYSDGSAWVGAEHG